MRKRFGIFEGFDQFQFGFFVYGPDRKFYGQRALLEGRRDADDVDAGGQSAFQVHEHLRPVEAARFDDRAEEVGAVLNVSVLLLGEEGIQVFFLSVELVNLGLHFLRAGTQIGIGFTQRVEMPTQVDEKQSCECGD